MVDPVIKYITIKGVLYRIEEYSYRGYADSIHRTSTMHKVPDDQVEYVLKTLEAQEKE
tara:strand:+ start:101 stop:274 length:174 start_codon:yes stop_codon:yes gene_type:complete